MKNVSQTAQIGERFLQIRNDFYDAKNRKMAIAIGENEGIISSICGGTRPIGLTTILRLANANPDVDMNWLLTGRFPKKAQPYKMDEAPSVLMAAEPSEPYGKKTDSVSWERYDAAQQEIGALRTRLEQSAESVARLLKENSDLRKNPASPSPATPEAPIFV
jgi:hypothetical protein